METMKSRTVFRAWSAARCAGVVLVCTTLPCTAVIAAEFSLYLSCQGKLIAGEKMIPSQLILALRKVNQTALIQKSNALPVGERLKYDVSPFTYSMTYKVPGMETAILYDWWRGDIFVWQPNLKKVATIRVSIDRQSGELSGEMLNAQAEQLARLNMSCDALSEDNLPPAKL